MTVNSVLIIALYSIIVVIQSSPAFQPIIFNIAEFQYEINSQFTKVKLQVSGGQGYNQFYFDQYPQGWKYIYDSIYVPSKVLKINRKYPIKVRAVDSEGNQARTTLVFLVENQRVVVSEFLYPYDAVFNYNFYNSNGYNGKPKMERSGSFYQIDNSYDNDANAAFMENQQTIINNEPIDQLSQISNQPGSGLSSFQSTYQINGDEPFSLTKYLQNQQTESEDEIEQNSGYPQSEQVQDQSEYHNSFESSEILEQEGSQDLEQYQVEQVQQQASQDQDAPSTQQSEQQVNSSSAQQYEFEQVGQENNGQLQGYSQSNINDVQQQKQSTDFGQLVQQQSPLFQQIVSQDDLQPDEELSENIEGSQQQTEEQQQNNQQQALYSQVVEESTYETSQPIQQNEWQNIQQGSYHQQQNEPQNQQADYFTQKQKLGNEETQINFADFGNINQLLRSYQQAKNSQNIQLETQFEQDSQFEQHNYPQQTNNLVYANLPSPNQLDSLILQPGYLGFMKLIQTIQQSGLSCEQVVTYLNVFMGRIKSAISMKKFAVNQLQILVQQSQNNYARLYKLVEDKKKKIQTYQIVKLKNQLNKQLNKIKPLYSSFNKYDLEREPIQRKIIEIKNKIVFKQKRSEIDRQQLIRQKLQYNNANLIIQTAQKILNQAKQVKDSIQKKIQQITSGIGEAQSTIQMQEQSVNKLQDQLSGQNSNLDQLKIEITKFELQVQRTREDVQKKYKKQSDLLIENALLQNRIRAQKKKMVTDEIAKLQEMIKGLQNSLPSIQQFIGDNSYNCLQKNKGLQITKEGNTTIYVVGVSDFGNYIENVYHLKLDQSPVKMPEKIRFRSVSILDPSWSQNYGQPYDTLSYLSTKDYSFDSDFNCLNPSSLISGTGVIKNIGNKFIDVKNDKQQVSQLLLVACSRIQTINNLPKIGQRVYWRGIASPKEGQYNAYRVLCI